MKINKDNIIISFDFTPLEYFLCKSDDEMLGEYTLNPRIDRSYKGKSDDVGMPKIYLSQVEADICRQNGFTEIINN